MTPVRLLIASAIRQRPEILSVFLSALQQLDLTGLEVEYYFIDDNDDPFSVKLLRDFVPSTGGTGRMKAVHTTDGYYPHLWTGVLIKKMTDFKEQIRENARQNELGIFWVDSDVILHPATVQQLLATEKDIVAELYWTKQSGIVDNSEIVMNVPQVWIGDPQSLFQYSIEESLSKNEKQYRVNNFLEQLSNPGLYEVGGVRGCIYISQAAIKTGVSFKMIANLNLPRADDYFSLRAGTSGFKLYVDTHCPAYHLLSQDDLPRMEKHFKQFPISLPPSLKTAYWKQEGKTLSEQRQSQSSTPKITLAMLVQNGDDFLLERTLTHVCQYIDRAVLLDEGGKEHLAAACRDTLKSIRFDIHLTTPETGEHNLRQALWDQAIATDPDWLLFLDPGEVFEAAVVQKIRNLVADSRWDHYAFPVYEFWDETHYREDILWQSHQYPQIRLLRHQPNFEYLWPKSGISSRLPENIKATPGTLGNLHIRDYGWATPEGRQVRYERYRRLSSGADYEITAKYKTLFDPNPRLVRFR